MSLNSAPRTEANLALIETLVLPGASAMASEYSSSARA
jgi:hypothetical protein